MKKIKVAKTMFLSSDNITFATEEECMEHENLGLWAEANAIVTMRTSSMPKVFDARSGNFYGRLLKLSETDKEKLVSIYRKLDGTTHYSRNVITRITSTIDKNGLYLWGANFGHSIGNETNDSITIFMESASSVHECYLAVANETNQLIMENK